MYKIDMNQPIKVHFIGIGGISMSGLAEILLSRGFTITGSDVSENDCVKRLKKLGATISRGHHSDNITSDIDLIIYTVAVKHDNVERLRGNDLSIPIMDRATLLGQIMDNYKDSIAVAGTHGKTTTTSMIAHILDAAKTDPTISVGGILPLIDGNIRAGQSSYFVTEACEYYDSFHHFYPKVAVVLNLEEDHLDYFDDLDHIRRSFSQFLGNVKEHGHIVINKDIDALEDLVHDYQCDVITYSVTDTSATYYADHITYNNLGHASFDVINNGDVICHLSLMVPGTHNISNGLAAFATATCFGLSNDSIIKGLGSFGGTHRRFEYKGSLGGLTIIDDYAHHPTEIKTTILGTHEMDINKLWVVFQPHTYSRTKAFLDDFAQALSLADHVIMMDIYSASREEDPGDIHSKDIQEKIEALGTPCEYFDNLDEIVYYIMTNCIPKDLLITMGAGDVYLVAESLLDV